METQPNPNQPTYGFAPSKQNGPQGSQNAPNYQSTSGYPGQTMNQGSYPTSQNVTFLSYGHFYWNTPIEACGASIPPYMTLAIGIIGLIFFIVGITLMPSYDSDTQTAGIICFCIGDCFLILKIVLQIMHRRAYDAYLHRWMFQAQPPVVTTIQESPSPITYQQNYPSNIRQAPMPPQPTFQPPPPVYQPPPATKNPTTNQQEMPPSDSNQQ